MKETIISAKRRIEEGLFFKDQRDATERQCAEMRESLLSYMPMKEAFEDIEIFRRVCQKRDHALSAGLGKEPR